MESATKNLWLWLTFFFPLFLFSQEAAYHFHSLANQGLTSQQHNYYIYKDSHGFVWISSTNGLNRFDGFRVREFGAAEIAVGKTNILSNFFEDKNSDIWFQARDSVFCYERKTEQISNTGLEGKPIFFDQERNEVWLMTRRKEGSYLQSFLTQSDSKTPNKNFLIGETYGHNIELHQWKKGKILCVAIENGFKVFEISGGNSLPLITKKKDGFNVHDFYLENDSTLWVGADTGLIKINLGTKKIEKIYANFRGNRLKSIKGIAPIGKNEFIVATHHQGIYIFDENTPTGFTKQFHSYFQETVIPYEEHIDEIYLDDSYNLWVSTENRGVQFTNIKKRRFNSFLQRSPQSNRGANHIEGLAIDQAGRIWCLTKNGVAVIDSTGNFIAGHEQYLNHGFGTQEPNHIFCDSNGGVWVGMQAGLYYTPTYGEPFKILEDSLGTLFIHELDKGRILTSTFGPIMEVYFEDGKAMRKPMQELSDTNGPYTMIYHDDSHAYFCQNEDSIRAYDLRNNELFFNKSFPFDGPVNGFAKDIKNRRTWVATDNGLYYFQNIKGVMQLQADTIFPNQICKSILLDGHGNLWLGTGNNGLVWNTNDNDLTKKSVYKFGIIDGVQGNEFNFWSASRIGNNFLFGGVNGVTSFDPSKIQSLATKAKPTIIDIIIKGERRLISNLEPLNYNENEVTLNLAAMEYSNPTAVNFRYKLKGEKKWNYIEEKSLSFTELREGDYSFIIEACNSDGVWENEHPAEFTITVLPPWYRTWWFYFLIGFLILFSIYAYYRNRIKLIKKEENYKRQLAELRQKEAEAKQQMAETETAILRLQMNPHFIFNSMNSINNYILEKDINTASDYLGRFSKLMRKILKLSANPYISVYEEIELLELYIKTEALRFEGRFSYDIQVDDDLDPDDTILPTMILQPFVENAIWHGLTGKDGKGHIDIQFQLEKDNSLICSITDNGIGRKAAALLQTKSTGHESKALAITERRLKLLGDQTKRKANCKITDIETPNGQPAGTNVILTLPLL